MLALPGQLAAQTCYEQVWADEFEGTGLPDASKWGYDVGGSGWGNNEAQYYSDARQKNARLENGRLIIEAHKESFGGKEYSSARLITKNKGDWKYGRVEVRAKLPAGRGTWPAIWMLPTDWKYGGWPASGEIDIMEHVGYDPTVVHGTVHTEAYNHKLGTQVGKSTTVADFDKAYHVYAMEWEENEIRMYVDDVHYFTFTKKSTDTYKQWPFDERFHMILNIAIGGDWGGAQGIDNAIFPVRMEVDYVRVFKKTAEIDPIMSLSGPDFADAQGTATFSAPWVGDATYTWTLPEGAQVVSGQGTNQLQVKWGDVAGKVAVKVQGACKQWNLEKSVALSLKPQPGKQVVLPQADGQVLRWRYQPLLENNSNSATLQLAADTVLDVDFVAMAPAGSPAIFYTLPAPADLRTHHKLSFTLKAERGKAPENIRVDLVDEQGSLYATNLYMGEDCIWDDGAFRSYKYIFAKTPATTGGNLARIKQVRMLFNYSGLLAAPKQGRFQLGSLRFSEPAAGESDALDCSNTPPVTGLEPEVESRDFFRLSPVPAADWVQLHDLQQRGVAQARLFDLQGRAVRNYDVAASQGRLSVQGLPAGMYVLRLLDGQGVGRALRLVVGR